jgi:hypothetical protein
VALVVNGLADAAGRFQQIERDLALDVAAAPRAVAAPAAAEDIAKHAVAEDIAEGRENVVDVREMRRAAGIDARVAVAVVARPLVGVAENLKGLGRLFELDDRFVVAGVLVGMVFDGQFAIGVGKLFFRGVAGDSQDLVIVTFGRHCGHGDMVAGGQSSQLYAKSPVGRTGVGSRESGVGGQGSGVRTICQLACGFAR